MPWSRKSIQDFLLRRFFFYLFFSVGLAKSFQMICDNWFSLANEGNRNSCECSKVLLIFISCHTRTAFFFYSHNYPWSIHKGCDQLLKTSSTPEDITNNRLEKRLQLDIIWQLCWSAQECLHPSPDRICSFPQNGQTSPLRRVVS